MAIVLLFTMAIAAATVVGGGADAAFVEHTFVVSQMNVKHLGKDTLVTLVNGQLPGPTIDVREGDSVAVHVINKSPQGITIHWHGVKHRLNCWADGAGMITQCPIQPNNNFTYQFDVIGQEGTLWWHAHVACLRGTIYGALLIRPRSGARSYPFKMPDMEIPIFIGEWWQMDLFQLDKLLANTGAGLPRASTINGKLGDTYNCSGVVEDNYILNVEHGKTYLLRIVNAALFSEYYFKIAGHVFTVVASDANYVKPYTTDLIAIAPGETVDALVVADAPPARYYMVALPNQRPKPDPQVPMSMSRGIVQYNPSKEKAPHNTPILPRMPDQHDSMTSFNFHRNLTNLPDPRLPPLPISVDERLFITLDLRYIYLGNERVIRASMNNISFQLPTTTSLLEAHYRNNMSSIDTVLQELPDMPPRMFNFTDRSLIPPELWLEITSVATVLRRFRYNTTVEIVFQSTALGQSESNPMHLHGHEFFVLAQGLGNYDAKKDAKSYNLVDPPLKNTVQVPSLGWTAIRFITDNPGVWHMHCHFDFHVSMGMGAAFVVDNGPTLQTTLPPPPAGFPRCHERISKLAYE